MLDMWNGWPGFKNEWHLKRLRLFGTACTRLCSLSDRWIRHESCLWKRNQKNICQPKQVNGKTCAHTSVKLKDDKKVQAGPVRLSFTKTGIFTNKNYGWRAITYDC